MAEIDVLKAQLVRRDLNQQWGFLLKGGADSGEPLSILRIAPGSPAARIGLRPGDELTEIHDTPTADLTCQEALALIGQFGDSIILTIERKARGSIPLNPIIQQQNEQNYPKDYQPLDMTGGARSAHRRRQPPTIDSGFYVAQSRPFEAPPPGQQRHAHPGEHQYNNPSYRPDAYQPASEPTPPPPYYGHYAPARRDSGGAAAYDDESYSPTGGVGGGTAPQSRTFRMLQSVMHDAGPGAGAAGLPPPRSAHMEQMKRERGAGRHPSGGGGRVKVFMPQQYNSPLGMYSADNVLETFTAQADAMLDNIERREHGEEEHPVYGSNGLLQ